MCFQTIQYKCGHEEKNFLHCRNRSGIRGFFKRVKDLLHHHQVRTLNCDHFPRVHVRRDHNCHPCLTRQIPDLLKREHRRLCTMRGDFSSEFADNGLSRSRLLNARPSLRPQRAKRDLHAQYRRHGLPRYAWLSSEDVVSDQASPSAPPRETANARNSRGR